MLLLTKSRKPLYSISHLYYNPPTQHLLQQYKSTPSGPYNLPLKFIPVQQKPTLWNKLFLDRHLAKHFQDTILFIHQCGRNSHKENLEQFPRIEENLMGKVQAYMKSRPQEVTVHECEVGRAYYVQQRKISGVFFHRKLNLARSCYSTQFQPKSGDLRYRLKSKLKRLQDLTQHQRAQHLYESQHFHRIYKDTYSGFQQTQHITRTLIKVVADLKVEIKVPEFEDSIRLGYDGPTEHLLQVESYKVPYQEEEWVVSDVDFFAEGNGYFLRERN